MTFVRHKSNSSLQNPSACRKTANLAHPSLTRFLPVYL